MHEKLKHLAQLIEAAGKAPITKQAKIAREAAQTAALLSAELVRGYDDLAERVAALEAAVGA